MSNDKVKILFVMSINSSGQVMLPEDIYEATFDPGVYAVVPLHQVETRTANVPVRRLFHLGDLRCLDEIDHIELSRFGISSSDQIRALGMENIKDMLGGDKLEKIVSSFASLGLSIPKTSEALQTQVSEEVEDSLIEEYRSYREVWKTKDRLTKSKGRTTKSTFARHEAGLDIVCASCDKQFVAVSEKDASKMVCPNCGNDIGLDFAVLLDHDPTFLR